jgi:hypothetical protein
MKKDFMTLPAVTSKSCCDLDSPSFAKETSSRGADPCSSLPMCDRAVSGQGMPQILYRFRSHLAGELHIGDGFCVDGGDVV